MVCKMVPGDNTPAVKDSESMIFSGNPSATSSSGQHGEIRMALIVVQDMTTATLQIGHTSLSLASTASVRTLVQQVATSTNYMNGTFSLLLQSTNSESSSVLLNERLHETLEAVGFVCDNGHTRNNLIIANTGSEPPKKESPVKPEFSTFCSKRTMDRTTDSNTTLSNRTCSKRITDSSPDGDVKPTDRISDVLSSRRRGFVGLVNQAMTCYLNSLIQTLFMTPEFRNAMYRWHFDGTEEEQAKSIPFQLQSLFLMLQTTDKSSIGTTNLTRSFGWDSSEAWQQHDIQELCRVMFDALEHKFKNTEQSDLISRLYEGKMMDYVRCLECRTDKAREDTFLDIPLPVRPFGSQTAYASIEEALKAFVAPETLDGNNQYWCEKCGKKCDAHKGLKFSRFPYLLTLHLKRFDFDYTTLHRIKLNDKVTFPEFLHLDSLLVDDRNGDPNASNKDSQDTAIEDSMSEASGSSRANSSNGIESQDDDEGIDVRTEGCTSSTSCASGASSGDQNRKNRRQGQYNYELFSIMIHSGSASGGHYYAYIKDFLTREWHCFNDQTVSSITYDDIRKTYGGGPSRSAGYFTSAYTSSTNAYMLMYRRIDKERNVNFISPSEFPEHLQQLLLRMQEEEKSQRAVEEQERNTCRIQLYCHHPKRGRIDLPLKLHKEITLRQAVSIAYEQIGDLSDIGVPLSRCRLVKYNELYDNVECSWDNRMEETVDDIFDGVRSSYKFDLLLEIVPEGQTFQIYAPGSLNAKVFMVDVDAKEQLYLPVSIRMPFSSTVQDLKLSIKSTMNIAEDPDHIHLVTISYSNELRRLTQKDRSLRSEGFQRAEKVYATVFPSSDESEFLSSCKPRLYDLIDQYENALTVRMTLPKADKETLDRLGIDIVLPVIPTASNSPNAVRTASPMESYSPEDAASDDSLSHLERERALSEGEEEEEENRRRRLGDIEDFAVNSANSQECYSEGEELPQRLPNSTSSASASEDSSLSLTNSERTLLGDPPEVGEEDCDVEIGLASRRRNALVQAGPESVDSVPELEPVKYFFKVISSREDADERICTAMVDKRIPLASFKSELEVLLNVPAEFLLLYKKTPTTASTFGTTEREWAQQNETLETLGDDPQIAVRLGRALRPGEVRGKIYQLKINDTQERTQLLFEWVLSSGIQIGKMKRDILVELKSRHGVEIPPEKCVLRKKHWRTPSTVYGDENEVLDTELLYIFKNWEMFLQVLDVNDPYDVASKYRGAETVIFTRRWRPSTFTLEPFVDTPLAEFNRIVLGKKLFEMSGLKPDQIEIAKAPGTFPCEGSLLGIHDDITWVPLLTTGFDDDGSFKYPCSVQTDGDVVYWREKGELLKKLTEQERREILSRENTDASVSGTSYPSVSASPRKERPLRIFIDSPKSTSVKETVEPDLD